MTTDQVSILILAVMIVLFVSEIVPVAVTAIGACVAMILLNVASPAEIWIGFSSETTLIVGGMMVVGIALIDTHVAKKIGNLIFLRFSHTPKIASFLILMMCILLSAILNNTTTVLTLLPVMSGIIVASQGKLHEKSLFIPLAVASNVGGMLTLIGTTAQMVAQNMLIEYDLEGFGFFEFAWIGIPISLVYILYYLTVGKYLSNKIWDPSLPNGAYVNYFMNGNNGFGGVDGRGITDFKVPIKFEKKQFISVAILLGTIYLMVYSELPKSALAIMAALLCIVTKMTTLSSIYKKMDWSTMFVLVGAIGFANGMKVSGGGLLIVDKILGLFVNQLSGKEIFILLIITASILTMFMSNTAVTALLLPIGFAFYQKFGINIYALAMGICMAANCSFSTPIATTSMTIVLGPGEYNFKDYFKWCLPLNVLAILVIIIVVPLVWRI